MVARTWHGFPASVDFLNDLNTTRFSDSPLIAVKTNPKNGIHRALRLGAGPEIEGGLKRVVSR